MYKKFNEINVNDTLYFIFDEHKILENKKFDNPKYGITIITRKIKRIDKDYWMKEMSIETNKAICNDNLCAQLFIVKKDLSSRMWFNKNYYMYCFTTKEEMEKYINDKISTILKNIEKIKNSLLEIE